MSNELFQYSINEILSLFTPSDPPEFLCDVSILFVEESRTPIANYPKNVTNITVAPKNTNLKATKSEPTRNEHDNLQNKISDFSPKLISKQSDKKIQKSTEFIPSFKPASVNANDNNNTFDSSNLAPNLELNPNTAENNIVLPPENSNVYNDAPIFVPQNTTFIPQDPPIFIPQNAPVFTPECQTSLYPQFPPGFSFQDYINNFSQFTPQYGYPAQIPNQSYEQTNQLPTILQEQPQNFFNANPTPSQSDNSINSIKEQMDGFESVIDSVPNISKNTAYTISQDEYIFNSPQSSMMPSQYAPQYQQPPQFQPPPQFHPPPQQFQQSQHQDQQDQQQQQDKHQEQQQQNYRQKQRGNQNNQKNNQYKDSQINNKIPKKNENKPKGTFSPDTVVEDVKNVKIASWGNIKSKTSQSFQEIEESAKSDELSNQNSSKPIILSSSQPQQSSSSSTSKLTITNVPNNNEGSKSKKASRKSYLSKPAEIPKPPNFTVDNIAISQVTNAPIPQKPVVCYNKNFSSIPNPSSTYVSTDQNQNSNNNRSFSITTQSNNMNKPSGFNPANIAVPPNFTNNFFPS